jgi:hypothetical protein
LILAGTSLATSTGTGGEAVAGLGSFSISCSWFRSLSTPKQIAQWTLSSIAANSSAHALPDLIKRTQKPNIQANKKEKRKNLESRPKCKENNINHAISCIHHPEIMPPHAITQIMPFHASTVWSRQKFHPFFFVATDPAREREREREPVFLASPETDPAAKSAGEGTPDDRGDRPPRGTGTTWGIARERERKFAGEGEKICRSGTPDAERDGHCTEEKFQRERGAALEDHFPPTGFQATEKKLEKEKKK